MTIDLKGTGVLDADGDILTRASGTPSGISRAALAADSAFTANRALTGGLSLTNATTDDVGPEMTLHGYNSSWLFGIDVANSPTSRDPVPVAVKLAYYLNDGVTTNGSPTLTSAAEGGFASPIVGATLSGTGIPGGTTIASVESATSLTMSANATASNTGVRVYVNKSGVTDLIYIKHRGALPPTIGFGVTPPNDSARVQVGAGHADDLDLGGIRILAAESFSGKYLVLTDSSGTDRLWFDSAGTLRGAHAAMDASLVIKAPDNANKRALLFEHPTSGGVHGFYWADNSKVTYRNFAGGVDFIEMSNSAFRHVSSELGFYAATPTTKPTGVAVTAAGIHAALVTLGLIAA